MKLFIGLQALFLVFIKPILWALRALSLVLRTNIIGPHGPIIVAFNMGLRAHIVGNYDFKYPLIIIAAQKCLRISCAAK